MDLFAAPRACRPRAPARKRDALLRRVVALAHVDDPERAAVYTQLTLPDAAHYEDLGSREQQLARMLFFTLWPDKGVRPYQAGLDHLRAHPAVCMEVRELLAMGADRSRRIPPPLAEGMQDIPLLSHARYRRERSWRPWIGPRGKVRAGPRNRCGVGARHANRRASGEHPQERGGVLALDDVPRLRDLAGPLPLGVAERHPVDW